MNELNVSALVKKIKDEILLAEHDAATQRKMFRLDEMELEIKFVVAKDESMKADFHIVVASGGGDVVYKDEQTQSVRLKFTVIGDPKPGKGRQGRVMAHTPIIMMRAQGGRDDGAA